VVTIHYRSFTTITSFTPLTIDAMASAPLTVRLMSSALIIVLSIVVLAISIKCQIGVTETHPSLLFLVASAHPRSNLHR
jgi:hypothetical protein